MANLIATSTWDAVYQLETTDQAIGGVNGTMNKQAQALNNRTQYLYDQVNAKISVEDLKTNLNAVGTAPMFVSRAWVNFNGTGTVAISSSGNITSITDNGVGDYTLNFTTAFQDSSYALAGACANTASWGAITVNVGVIGVTRLKTPSAVKIHTKQDQGGSVDTDDVSVIIFR